jgi:hypothetical protein
LLFLVPALLCGFFLVFREHVESHAQWKDEKGEVLKGGRYKFPFGSLFAFNSDGGQFALRQSNTYGSIYRLFYGIKPVCVLANLEDVKVHYQDQTNHPRERNLGFGYPFGPLLGESLGAKHGQRWTFITSHFKTLMSAPHVKSMVLDCIAEAQRWVDAAPWATDTHFDMTTSISSVSFRFMSRVLFGNLTEEEHTELARMGELHAPAFNAIWTHWGSKLPGYPILPTQLNRSLNKFLSLFKEFVGRKVDQYMETDDGSLADMGILFTTVNAIRNGAMNITMEEFSQTLYEMLFANLDVTSAVITWAVAQTAMHPTAQDTLRAELRAAGDIGETITEEVLEKCAYLNALVYESARLRPILAISFPEQTVKDQVFSGYHVPASTCVAVDFVSINRDPKYFPNPDAFVPERFLPPCNEKSEQTTLCNPQHVARIGFGARRCPGFRYGDLMVKTVLASLFRKYCVTALHIAARKDTALITPKADLSFSAL